MTLKNRDTIADLKNLIKEAEANMQVNNVSEEVSYNLTLRAIKALCHDLEVSTESEELVPALHGIYMALKEVV